MAASVDWQGARVETAELSINVARAGKGPPVVFLHGWPEFNRTWLHNIPVLADRFDCIAPDLRGFGRTVSKVARAPDGTPPQLLARDLKDLADGLGLGVAWAAIIGAVAAWDAWTRRRRRPR